jgi:17beta-estradiol 17-dehydrogenase / very-long-chain 3-oxoacyl-CoA reductase
MSKIRRASISTPTPKAFVRSTLSRIGLSGGAIARPFTLTPYWSHSIADFVIGAIAMPSIFISYTHRKSYKGAHKTPYLVTPGLHTGIRARALKKRAKQQ